MLLFSDEFSEFLDVGYKVRRNRRNRISSFFIFLEINMRKLSWKMNNLVDNKRNLF